MEAKLEIVANYVDYSLEFSQFNLVILQCNDTFPYLAILFSLQEESLPDFHVHLICFYLYLPMESLKRLEVCFELIVGLQFLVKLELDLEFSEAQREEIAHVQELFVNNVVVHKDVIIVLL